MIIHFLGSKIQFLRCRNTVLEFPKVACLQYNLVFINTLVTLAEMSSLLDFAGGALKMRERFHLI